MLHLWIVDRGARQGDTERAAFGSLSWAVAVLLAGCAAALLSALRLYSNCVRSQSQTLSLYLCGAVAHVSFLGEEMNPSEDVLMLVRKAIQESGLPKAVIARDAHVSRSTLDSWIAGVRIPRPNSLQHLAAGLDRRAQQLQEMAAELRKAASEAPNEQ